jgi:hypothetical protein
LGYRSLHQEMFDRPTVFVLGAGASWHFGYPIGEELLSRVMMPSTEFADFMRNCSAHDQQVNDQLPLAGFGIEEGDEIAGWSGVGRGPLHQGRWPFSDRLRGRIGC